MVGCIGYPPNHNKLYKLAGWWATLSGMELKKKIVLEYNV